MDKTFVDYNGTKVIEGWPEKIEAAQVETSYVISGVTHLRVAYGSEEDDWGADKKPCHDCAVIKGQLHLSGCDVERCPVCSGQAMCCECEYEEDDE